MKTEDRDNRKILSALVHASLLFNWTIISIGIPIAIFVTTEDPVIKSNAKEVLNFIISFVVYVLVSLILFFIVIGIPLFVFLLVADIVLPIIAVIKVIENPDKYHRYPFIFRLL